MTEIEKLQAENERLEKEIQHWRSNHDEQVKNKQHWKTYVQGSKRYAEIKLGMDKLEAENTELKQIVVNLHWMARRYADGRCTYAPGMVNDAVRKLQAMGVELNICGERTPWARDGMGPGFSGLSKEEYEMGEPVDGWNQISETEEIKALAAELSELKNKFLLMAEVLEQAAYCAELAIGHVRDAYEPDSDAVQGVEGVMEACNKALSTTQPDIQRIRDEIRAEAWLPIETAPKDETTVDLWLVGTPWPDKPETNIGYRLTDCWYCPGEKAWVRTGFFDEIEKIEGDGLVITHWMLPLPPNKKEVE